MKPQAFFVVSRYNEPFDWINEYTDDYIVYNKGKEISDNIHVVNVPNIGSNQRDILYFIYENYRNLPRLTAFIQANPFDHCKKETFDKLILNKKFTSIEDYSHVPEGNGHKKDYFDNGYMEINTSWYIPAHNSTYGLTCKYNSFHEFMNKYFTNYNHLEWLRFCPGSQYIVERKQILYYSKNFWYSMMNELNDSPRPTVGHIIERMLFLLFQCNLQVKDEYK